MHRRPVSRPRVEQLRGSHKDAQPHPLPVQVALVDHGVGTQPLYAKQVPRKCERGTDLYTQTNPLPMCHFPAVLVKVTAS